MANQRRYKGLILDNEYIVIGTESETHMDAVFELANQQLQQIKALSPDMTNEQAATLLALNALSDQLKMQVAGDEA
ncbi:MAG: cell division protein ZapA [Lactobacillaceae bacterium]|jgi:cell division protein ZapA|nr:cell division protein ZapA [Lactobacillaceae bacterium]